MNTDTYLHSSMTKADLAIKVAPISSIKILRSIHGQYCTVHVEV